MRRPPLPPGPWLVVGLARGLVGYVVPSRLYGVLAVGRPVIAAAEESSETASVVRAADCGLVVPPGRPELLARALRRAYDGELDLQGMGERGRTFVAAEGDNLLDRAHRETLGDDALGQPLLGRGIVETQQRPGVPGREG